MSCWIHNTANFGRIDPGVLLSLNVLAAFFSQIFCHSLQMSSLEPFSNIFPCNSVVLSEVRSY